MSRARQVLESRAFVPGCLLAALVVRVVCVAVFPVPPVSDFEFYFHRAFDLAAGRGMMLHGAPTAYWPVGYSLFLAGIFMVTGPSLAAALAANVVLSVAALWLVHWIALRLTGSRLAAALALALMAFLPNQIAYCALTANETLSSFLILAGTALLIRAWSAAELPVWTRRTLLALSGVVFGIGCLAKPQIAILPTLCVAWLAWRDRQPWLRLLGSLLLVNVALAVTILPWMVRNLRTFGHVVFIANTGGVNLFLGNNPMATGGYPDPESERKLAVILHSFGKDENTIDRVAAHEALAYIGQHPARTLGLMPAKLFHLYSKDVDGFSWIGEALGAKAPRVLGPLKLVAELYYLGLLALFLAALVWPRHGRLGVRAPDSLPLVIIASFTAIYLVYFANSRYHFPLLPWMAIYVGAFLAALMNGRRSAWT